MNMRWTKMIVGILASCLFLYAIAYIYPFVMPILNHPPQQHLASAIINAILSSHADQGVGAYYPFVLISVGFIMYLVIGYDLKHPTRQTHGSARYAGRRETRKYGVPRVAQRFRQPGRSLQSWFGGSGQRRAFWLLLGKSHGRGVGLDEYQQYQHTLLTAPTGAGKSTRFFLPNLLREDGARSLFIADLKGELYTIAAGWLSQSMQIWLFAPTQPQVSQGYNPLAHIHSVEDAQDFAECWVTNTGTSGGKDTFWETNSKLLITAMVLHLITSEKAPAFSRLADVLTTQSYEQIRDILTNTRSRDARYIARQFLENMEKNERQVASQMTDLGNRFQLLASAPARAVTSTNEIDFTAMIETPTAFFLSIPRSSTKRYRPLMATLMLQMFASWEKRGTNGVGCYLDEFTNVGYIPGYAEFISTARALKVSLLMAIQNFSQLVERYGKNDADTIKANAVTHLLLPGAGLEECRYYSERIGDTTVPTYTMNRRGSGLSEEITSSESEAKRRLMTPDELRTMLPDQMLMLAAAAAPLLLQTTQYFQDRRLADRANWPLPATTHVHVEPTPPQPQAPRNLPPGGAPGKNSQQPDPPIIVDADVEEDDQFIQQE